jgi:hypothetical protein
MANPTNPKVPDAAFSDVDRLAERVAALIRRGHDEHIDGDIEIIIDGDGHRVWINDADGSVVRVQANGKIFLNDRRRPQGPWDVDRGGHGGD